MDTSVFEQIASSLTVNSICGSLGPDIAAGTAIDDLFSDPDFERWGGPCRVIGSDGNVVGMLSFNDVMACNATGSDETSSDETSDPVFIVDQIVENIEPHRFLSRDTTILDAVELFSASSETHYYVIHTNKIVGTLCFSDLFKPLGRLTFLALALEIDVLFKQCISEAQPRCGNFTPAAYQAILDRPSWKNRICKPHPRKSAFYDADKASAKELDSCCSSDALLMNIVCHPSSRTNQQLWELFGFNQIPAVDFGFKANLPFGDGGTEPTSSEIDLRLSNSTGDLTIFVEAKLTEPNFTKKDIAHVNSYRGFASVFSSDKLPTQEGQYLHYQLLRNVIAANYYQVGFCLVCDERRPDLQEAWGEVNRAILSTDLKERCLLITWQQVATVLSAELQTFLADKYGILGHIH